MYGAYVPDSEVLEMIGKECREAVTIDNNCFSVPQICESGQCFRLDKTAEDTYELLASDRYLKITLEDKNGMPGKTFLHCTEKEYEGFWKAYFDIDTCYEEHIARIADEDEYLKQAARFGSGIRILRQDIWEMIITFILSQQNNIPRIKGLIRGLSERYGQKKETLEGRTFYTFPDVKSLAQATEEELRKLKLGYRSKYICGTAAMISEGIVDLEKIKEMDYLQARSELMRLPGIGDKVADCICLFALHQMDAFPVDTHIQKVLDAQYAGGFPFDRYKGCAGIMQQYIFYYDLKHSSATY